MCLRFCGWSGLLHGFDKYHGNVHWYFGNYGLLEMAVRFCHIENSGEFSDYYGKIIMREARRIAETASGRA
ncbi:hypothetical protein AALB53_14990 [Lachnospiraceae bacterium 47-T17]